MLSTVFLKFIFIHHEVANNINRVTQLKKEEKKKQCLKPALTSINNIMNRRIYIIIYCLSLLLTCCTELQLQFASALRSLELFDQKTRKYSVRFMLSVFSFQKINRKLVYVKTVQTLANFLGGNFFYVFTNFLFFYVLGFPFLYVFFVYSCCSLS